MASAILNSLAPASATDQLDIAEDIPVFDLSHIRLEELVGEGFDEDYRKNLLRSEFKRCCEVWGCFRLTNHGISDQLMGRVEILSRDVFKLPAETKEKRVSPLSIASYVKGGPKTPFYESIGIGPDFEGIEEFSDLMWPHGNQHFCEVMREYFERMKELSDGIHKIILANLGVSNYYASHFEHCKRWLRINKYEATCDEVSGSITFPAHTDGTSITILREDEVGGLQVLSQAGNWLEVKPSPNSFIIILGDTLKAWSNKRIHSAKHRVIVKGRQPRLSLTFFRLLPDEMQIDAPPELVDNEHPRRYRAFHYSDYTAFKLRTKGEVENPLEAYAAVQQ